MTIPQYSLLTRQKLPALFPPTVDREHIPKQFALSYKGNRELRRRIFRALLAYAASQISFWQFSIVIVAVGSLGAALSSRGQPGWYGLVLAMIVVLGALVMPIWITVEIRRAAESYAIEGSSYSSTLGQKSILWSTPLNTYEIPWGLIDRALFKRGVTILTLKDSTAICVLPSELVDAPGAARLKEIEQGRRELS